MLPLALAGGAATLGSMFLNNSAQGSVDAARNAVIQAERARQAGFDAETGKLNDQSLGRYANFDQKMAADAAALAELFKTPVITPNTQYTQAPLPPVSSGIVGREVDAKNGIAQAYLDHQGDTLAELRSFGDTMGTATRGQAKDAQLVGQIGGFKKGSSQVEQLELDNANRAGNTAKMWADIAAGLGKVGLTAGLSGVMAPAAAATGAAGAPLNILPAVAQTAPSLPANIFSTGAAPFLNYGRR